MKPSLKKFKEDFQNNLLDIHWKQWGCLGVASQLEEEKRWIIDLEALLSSTIFMGQFDKRLLSSAIEWANKYSEWINVSKLKRIGAAYYRADEKLNVGLAAENIYNLVENTIKKRRKVDSQQIQEEVSHYDLSNEYRQVLEKFQIRGITTPPAVQKPSLLQLWLRGFFGVNARAEVLLYLLYKKQGSSNQIAGTIQFDQKIVYRILEKWSKAGFVEKERGRKYILANPNGFAKLLGHPVDKIKYLNWIETFLIFARIMKSLCIEPWASDSYLLSSLFRKISEEIRDLSKETGVSFSESSLYKGEEYLSFFINDILDTLNRL